MFSFWYGQKQTKLWLSEPAMNLLYNPPFYWLPQNIFYSANETFNFLAYFQVHIVCRFEYLSS